jgi:dCTP diphosphatase
VKNLDLVMQSLLSFVEERDWAQFHTTENLAKSVSIEAGELLQCFQWGGTADRDTIEMELADVMTYCLLLANALEVDWVSSVAKKLELSKEKYPVNLVFGVSSKYDQLPN